MKLKFLLEFHAMAEVLDNEPTWGTRPRKYPWEQWLDGQVWKLKKGVDFHTSVQGIRNAARNVAKSLGHDLRVSVTHEGDVILKAIHGGAAASPQAPTAETPAAPAAE